jgi:hypothetical protein
LIWSKQLMRLLTQPEHTYRDQINIVVHTDWAESLSPLGKSFWEMIIFVQYVD